MKKAKKNATKNRIIKNKKVEGVQKLQEKHGNDQTHLFVEFNMEECRVYLQF